MLELVFSTVGQGLEWSVMAIGVFLTFRILDVADLSVEGTFPLGAAVAATCIAEGLGIVPGYLLAILAGGIAGAVTGLLTTKLRIPALLSGILTMIGLYSVNLHVMGKANVGLLQDETIFTLVEKLAPVGVAGSALIVGAVLAFVVASIIYWFFGTEIGTAVRATGFNPQMARAQGINTNAMVVLGLVVSNALVAVSGATVAQANGFADVGMGTGTIVIGLASVIIGEVLFSPKSFKTSLVAVVLGSIVYRIVIALVLEMGMPPNDLKLFTAVLVAAALSLPLLKTKLSARSIRG
ncbi:ABC transporter permease [Sutterella massiliensis]|mgnify:FL=1|uniref:ABC transporter permease n=1 Tax=Sutterella massiliensis TaxID=1816689 RepID=A0ABS2DVX1_9BURK|nr:ABC transporter permease [Sutterella massiliensis]MBM6704875.1 ABC transporter permease [Sutterella massiliensis]